MPIRMRPAVLALLATGLALLAAAEAQAAGACETLVTVFPVAPAASCPGASTLAVLQPAPLTWCYQVRNSGDVLLSGVSIVDSVFGVLTGNAGDLAPGQLSTPLAFSSEAFLNAHSAQATGSAQGRSIGCTPGTVEVVQAAPGISIDLTATVDAACPGHNELIVSRGTDITYCYAVTNTDSVTTLAGIEVTDDLFGPSPIGHIEALAPGATQVLTATTPMLMHDQTSFATAAGTPVFGRQTFPAVSSQDSIVVDVQ